MTKKNDIWRGVKRFCSKNEDMLTTSISSIAIALICKVLGITTDGLAFSPNKNNIIDFNRTFQSSFLSQDPKSAAINSFVKQAKNTWSYSTMQTCIRNIYSVASASDANDDIVVAAINGLNEISEASSSYSIKEEATRLIAKLGTKGGSHE